MSTEKPKEPHLEIYFRLLQEIDDSRLIKEIRGVKDIDVPLGNRDYAIAFYEATACTIGATNQTSLYKMTLEDAIEVPEKVQPFFEKHKADKVLRIRRLRSDASRKKVDRLVIDLHRELCCKDVLIGTAVYYDREHDSLIYL